MKKKILAATFAVACLAGCAFGLAACSGGNGGGSGGNGGGEKTLSSLAIFDNSDVDKGLSYDLGKFYYNTDVRLNSQFKLYAKFSDGTKEEINKNDSELTVSCYYADSEHTSLPQHFDLGGYSVTYSYNDYRASVSFDIVPSATASPCQLTLNGSMNFKYLEQPDLSVKKGDDTVSEYDVWYVTEADYNQIRNASAAEFGDLLNEKREYYSKWELKPGTYYLFAIGGGCSNSTFQRVIVNKADVVPSVTTGFNGYYNYMWGAVGKIKLSELQINRPEDLTLTASTDGDKEVRGKFEWVDGEEEVDSTNSGETKSIKFVPEEGDYAQCFNERIFYNVPLNIQKFYVYAPYLADVAGWSHWDGEDHEIKLGLEHSLDYFKAHVTVTHGDSEVEVGDDLVLGSKSEIGEYRYNFELKDKVNYYWINYQDPDDKSDVANKYFVYSIIPRSSYINIYSGYGEDYKIDENLQVKIQIKPGNQSDGCNASPYKAGTLQAVILETYQLDEHNIYNTTVDADLEIVNENGYDWIVITINQFPDWVYGKIIVKITAEGDDHYADIDKLFTSLEIYRYEPENITCPITSGTLIEKTVGTTVSELYETYPELVTKLGKWELYMYVGVVEDNYMVDKSDSSWQKLEDTQELPAGELKCKLKYESDFVDDVYDIPEVALTLKGI